MDAIWNLHNVQPRQSGFGEPTSVEVAPESMPQPDLAVNIQDDGSVIVDLSPQKPKQTESFDENLALILQHGELSSVAETLLEGIDADMQSREEWLAIRAKGMDLLALKLEDPKGDVGQTSAPVEGMSTVRHPLLLEAVLTAWSNARGELLPAAGPVKVTDNGKRSNARDILADQLERDLNFYLTKKAKEYYPDTDRLLLMTVFGGSGFKKVYMDPMRRRPVSESVDAADLIVNNAATDLRNAGRITHKIMMTLAIL